MSKHLLVDSGNPGVKIGDVYGTKKGTQGKEVVTVKRLHELCPQFNGPHLHVVLDGIDTNGRDTYCHPFRQAVRTRG